MTESESAAKAHRLVSRLEDLPTLPLSIHAKVEHVPPRIVTGDIERHGQLIDLRQPQVGDQNLLGVEHRVQAV